MKRKVSLAALSGVAGLLLAGSTAVPSAHGVIVDQKRAFGTIARGSTVCVGPLSPSTADGVQLFAFTNGTTTLTWQVLTTSAETAPTVVFQSTELSASKVVPPSGNLQFEACVVKTANAAQDFDLTLNSAPVG
ncbi:MAG: hypothetical protein ACJ73S_04745 [Mycobacteriales bacterium]